MIRTYGVEDDPKQPLKSATWLGWPLLETLERLGMRIEEVWEPGQDVPFFGMLPCSRLRHQMKPGFALAG